MSMRWPHKTTNMCDVLFCDDLPISPWQWIRPVRHTHTDAHHLFPISVLFHSLLSPLNFPPRHPPLTLYSQWLLVGGDDRSMLAFPCVCVCSQVGQAQGNLCSASGWRRGSGCVVSPWVSCCVPSCSLTAIEGVTFGTPWREESSFLRSVSLCY